MDVNIYSVTADDTDMFAGMIPEDVVYRIGRPGYFSLGAVSKDDDVLGILIFYIGVLTDKTYYAKVYHIFVNEDYRRAGVGTALMEKMHSILDSAKIEESQLLVPEKDAGNAVAKAFFKHLGYTFEGEKTKEYRGEMQEMLEEDYTKKNAMIDVKPLSALTEKSFLELLNRIVDNTDNEEGEFATAVELEYEIDAYDLDISSFYSLADGEGVLLVRDLGDDIVESAFLRTYGKDAEDNVFELALTTAKFAQLELDADSYVVIENATEMTEEIMKEFAPKVKPITFEKGIRLLG